MLDCLPAARKSAAAARIGVATGSAAAEALANALRTDKMIEDMRAGEAANDTTSIRYAPAPPPPPGPPPPMAIDSTDLSRMMGVVNVRLAGIEGGHATFFLAQQNHMHRVENHMQVTANYMPNVHSQFVELHNQMIQIKDHVDDKMIQIQDHVDDKMTQIKDQVDDKMTQIKDLVDDETTQIKDQLKFMQGELAKVQPQQANMNAGLPAPFVSPFKNWWANNVQECSLSTIVFNDLMTAVKRSRLYGDKTMTMDYLRCLVVFELGLKWTNEGARGHWYLPGYKIV